MSRIRGNARSMAAVASSTRDGANERLWAERIEQAHDSDLRNGGPLSLLHRQHRANPTDSEREPVLRKLVPQINNSVRLTEHRGTYDTRFWLRAVDRRGTKVERQRSRGSVTT